MKKKIFKLVSGVGTKQNKWRNRIKDKKQKLGEQISDKKLRDLLLKK